MRLKDFLNSRGRTVFLGRASLLLRNTLKNPTIKNKKNKKIRGLYEKMKSQPIPEIEKSDTRGRLKNLEDHLDAIYREFSGKSELCYFHAKVSVKIRRGIELGESVDHFLSIWDLEGEHLSEQLNARWLLSALDTFSDYGNEKQRPIATLLSTMINTLKMAETEHAILGSKPSVDALQNSKEMEPFEFLDGIESFRTHNGDMLRNLIERIDRVMEDDKTIRLIYVSLLKKTASRNNLLSRMIRANRYFEGVNIY